uniref:Uncharacterized protein n=1 Tax=Oryza glumipatula TaxID=40148 RepID=A0A0D9YQ27_9ORYZ
MGVDGRCGGGGGGRRGGGGPVLASTRSGGVEAAVARLRWEGRRAGHDALPSARSGGGTRGGGALPPSDLEGGHAVAA